MLTDIKSNISVARLEKIIVKVTLSALLSGSITTTIIIILVFYLEEIGVSAPSPSYATDSLGYEIQELGTFLVSSASS